MNVWKCAGASVLAFAGWMASVPARAGELECKMNFNLAGWSVFYQTATGNGTVHCSNGQSMSVHLRVKGGGLTFGKSQITNGVGKFSGIGSISEIKGHYADAGAHAGAVNSAGARVMTKGNVSLALSGTGKGWDLGVAFGAFIIE
ncbi:hypothetical protein [Dyella japonica]|uniref:Secreted protein n=1 Tax=Dyella japonica TaxID=231455 RepID=A0ABV2JVJ2_9GAMM